VLETAQQEQSGVSPNPSLRKPKAQQVIITKITGAEKQELTQLIYHKFEFLDLLYKQIIMRIPEINTD
jgi:hypothetical protein